MSPAGVCAEVYELLDEAEQAALSALPWNSAAEVICCPAWSACWVGTEFSVRYICAAISAQAFGLFSSPVSLDPRTTLAVPSVPTVTDSTDTPGSKALSTTGPSQDDAPFTSAWAAAFSGSIRLRTQIGSATIGGVPLLLDEPFAGKYRSADSYSRTKSD